MQNYQRIYEYIYEYWKEIYDIYGKHAIAYLATYYNIDTSATVWDNENLMGGYYEKIGPLSGVKWNKYLLLPVYYIEETDTIFDAQDIGYVNEKGTGFVIPSSYGITPYPNDMIKVDQTFLFNNPSKDINPLYCVTGAQKQSPFDKTFWKLKLTIEESKTTTQLDLQVSNTYIFYDYDKNIHTVSDAQTLTKMLSKVSILRSNLKNLYDENSGFYFI
jgi:hypothetical protein